MNSYLRRIVRVATLHSTMTAAVVGVVLNLAVWFALSAVHSENGRVDWFPVLVATVAFVGLTRYQWGIVPVVIGGGLLGLLYQTIL